MEHTPKKIIAREVPPDSVDFSFYFDDDGLKSEGGMNCACYIIPGNRRRNTGFNMDEYKEIERRAGELIDGFTFVADGCIDTSYKEVIEDLGIDYSDEVCAQLVEWAAEADVSNSGHIADYLTITTGEAWDVRAFCGYSQGDYCEVVYCPAHYTKEHITEIGKFWLGCGTEFVIDDCGGYFVIDDVRWNEGSELAKALADMYGCKPEELEVYLYAGEHRVPDYKLMTA